MKPPDDFLLHELLDYLADQIILFTSLVWGINSPQESLDLVVGKSRAQKGTLHGISSPIDEPRPVQKQMIGREGRANRPSGVTGRRLNPDFAKRPFPQEAAVT